MRAFTSWRGLRQCRLGRGQRVAGGTEVVVRHDVAFKQLRRALHVQFRRGELCLSTFHVGLGFRQSRLVRYLINNEQHLSPAYFLSLADTDVRDKSAHLRTYLHHLPALQAGSVFRFQRAVFGFHGQRAVVCRFLYRAASAGRRTMSAP